MNNRRKRGDQGEDYACGVLEAGGYRILDRNVHSRYGEIDIIAATDGVVAFVEVKTRKTGAPVGGGAAVGARKQRKIILTALAYLQAHPELDQQPRFDLFLVETDGKGRILRHETIEGAFDEQAYQSYGGPPDF